MEIFLMTHIKFIKKEEIIRMKETCYQKEIERIKSMLEDYYNKDFNSEEDGFSCKQVQQRTNRETDR